MFYFILLIFYYYCYYCYYFLFIITIIFVIPVVGWSEKFGVLSPTKRQDAERKGRVKSP